MDVLATAADFFNFRRVNLPDLFITMSPGYWERVESFITVRLRLRRFEIRQLRFELRRDGLCRQPVLRAQLLHLVGIAYGVKLPNFDQDNPIWFSGTLAEGKRATGFTDHAMGNVN